MKGTWKPFSMPINGTIKSIAGRVLDTSQPVHAGNIEHYGEYTEDYAKVQKICEQMNMNEVYIEHGYKNRDDYHQSLSEEYGIDLEIVKSLADSLGEYEDFDGLVTLLKDDYEGW